jgi:CheY-like chemotaxis protein
MAKIMLVEDDNNLREIYEARLLAEGYEIVSAKDGEEALAMAVKEKPDLIISDVMMPKISGFDMLDILRSTPETKHTKIIMMTALSQAEDKARADKLGADKYLVKSQVTLEDVAKVAREILNGEEGSSTDGPGPFSNSDATSETASTAAEPDPSVVSAPLRGGSGPTEPPKTGSDSSKTDANNLSPIGENTVTNPPRPSDEGTGPSSAAPIGDTATRQPPQTTPPGGDTQAASNSAVFAPPSSTASNPLRTQGDDNNISQNDDPETPSDTPSANNSGQGNGSQTGTDSSNTATSAPAVSPDLIQTAAPAPSGVGSPTTAPALDTGDAPDVNPNLAQTSASEEAAVDAQIKDFVNTMPSSDTGPGPAASPTDQSKAIDTQQPSAAQNNAVQPRSELDQSSSTPAPGLARFKPQDDVTHIDVASAPNENTAAAADNASKLASAVNDIMQKDTDEPVTIAVNPTEPSPPADEKPTVAPVPPTPSMSEGATVNGKKVVHPITDNLTQKPDLNELLKKEQALEEALTPIDSVPPGPLMVSADSEEKVVGPIVTPTPSEQSTAVTPGEVSLPSQPSTTVQPQGRAGQQDQQTPPPTSSGPLTSPDPNHIAL